jgi:hypothetical protein
LSLLLRRCRTIVSLAASCAVKSTSSAVGVVAGVVVELGGGGGGVDRGRHGQRCVGTRVLCAHATRH